LENQRFNMKKEMAKMYKDVSDQEDSASVMSSIDVKEYWENIKRTAKAEHKIITEMVDGLEDPYEKEDYYKNVMKQLHQEKEGEEDFEEEEENQMDFHSPKNEFERMLHRKIFELNHLQTEFNSLQLQLQKERSLKLKAEENNLKILKQHEAEKKSLALSVKKKIQEYFERKVMNVGLMYKKEIVSICHSQIL